MRADALMRRLRERFAPQGLLHYGLGKWYPGEAMPRWAFALYWRRDGKPMWRDAALIARESDTRARDARRMRRRFAEAVAAQLGIAADARAGGLRGPGALDAGRRQAAGERRCRSIRSCSMPRRAPAWCAPSSAGSARRPPTCCRCAASGDAWVSEAWELRREKLFLLPGDLPAGSRLPLASLPHVEPADYPIVTPADPMAEAPPLPDPATAAARRGRRSCAPRSPSSRATAGSACSCRYVGTLEDYLAVVAAVEAAAAQLATPVHIEGYAPPADPRLDVIKVTPDPGVIEVNLHPARSWREARRRSRKAFTRMRARPGSAPRNSCATAASTGTGGGSHIVVGGATPAESPFLRRPDLLKSIVLYWQRHPSLSYLFSGLFIGPTSQSPRVDEARHEALYELEIALAQVPKAGEEARPVAGRPPVPQSAGRRHRQHASRRDLRRQAVLAGFARPAGSAWSNSAPSRWRPTRAWRSRSNCWCAR